MSKLSIWIDSKLLKFQWYRNWQANRSRKRLEKQAALPEYKEVEAYDAAGVAEKERIRYEAILAKRREQDIEIARQDAENAKLADEAQANSAST